MTHLFSVFHDFKFSGVIINKDLELISDWAFQRKMRSQWASVRTAYSRKKIKSFHPSGSFNNSPVSSAIVHKYLEMLLDDKLSYEHHFNFVLNKAKKKVAILRSNFSKFSLVKLIVILPSNYNLQIF